jgi:hypothetical protein
MVARRTGWYPDPADEDAQRYWDGESWGPPTSRPPTQRRDRKTLWQGIGVAVVTLAIAATFLLIQKPWTGPKPHGTHKSTSHSTHR